MIRVSRKVERISEVTANAVLDVGGDESVACGGTSAVLDEGGSGSVWPSSKAGVAPSSCGGGWAGSMEALARRNKKREKRKQGEARGRGMKV